MEATHPSSSPLQMISDQPRVWLQLAEQTLAFPAPKASLLPLDLWKQLENQPHTDVSTARPHSCEPLSSPGPSISQSLAQDHGGGGGGRGRGAGWPGGSSQHQDRLLIQWDLSLLLPARFQGRHVITP